MAVSAPHWQELARQWSQRLRQQPCAHGGPIVEGRLRVQPQDFRVEERLPFAPSGEGEHVLLWVEKTAANTQWVARQLARFCQIRPRDVGYAGLKDRNAVTRQYFSVHLPGRDDPDWQQLRIDGVVVLSHRRHHRKLRPGALSGNHFAIVVRELSGDFDGIAARVASLQKHGAPNFFGPQRFGRWSNGVAGNLLAALRLFDGQRLPRDKRGLMLSAARSFLFNDLLAQRVKDASWCQALEGDVFILDGRHGRFGPQAIDEDIEQRMRAGEIHASGPLWGEGLPGSAASVLELEQQLEQRYPEFCQGLSAARVGMDRRALRMMPRSLNWSLEDRLMRLQFELPAGCFATSVLREILVVERATPEPERVQLQ